MSKTDTPYLGDNLRTRRLKVGTSLAGLEAWLAEHGGDVDTGVFRDECDRIADAAFPSTNPYPGQGLVTLHIGSAVVNLSGKAAQLAGLYPHLPGAHHFRST